MKWKSAGERADPVEAAARRRELGKTNQQKKVAAESNRVEGERIWRAGIIQPWVISMMLDARGLEGPGVDVACGAMEPDVDLWEAGLIYPTLEQFFLLAKLCEVGPKWFAGQDPTAITNNSLRFHLPPDPDEEPRVLRFSPEAIWARLHPDEHPLPKTDAGVTRTPVRKRITRQSAAPRTDDAPTLF